MNSKTHPETVVQDWTRFTVDGVELEWSAYRVTSGTSGTRGKPSVLLHVRRLGLPNGVGGVLPGVEPPSEEDAIEIARVFAAELGIP